MLFGGRGGDLIKGEQGSDLIVGGEGSDILIGGDGADLFCFAKSESFEYDVLVDFDLSEDRICFFDIDYKDLSFSQHELGTEISHSGDTMLIEGVSPEQMSSFDFHFL